MAEVASLCCLVGKSDPPGSKVSLVSLLCLLVSSVEVLGDS